MTSTSTQETQAAGPLNGVRVLDLTHVLNGPFATMLLAHMGADVIKVEHGSGDVFRRAWMPIDSEHDGYEFAKVNANKRCITLNLKHERGQELFRQLVVKSDVLVENFSLGVMDRLGLGYADLRRLNPAIIYACSRGYGESGPRARERANAATINASTGWTSTAWEYSGGPGTKVLGIGDEAAGVSVALGILAALFARERTGVGQKVEVSMQEALLGFMTGAFHTHFEGQRVGREPMQCADGWVAFHTPAFTDRLWADFAKAMGHADAATDPRFATVDARRRNFDELEGTVIPQWVRERTRQEMQEVFEITRVSAASVVSLEEVLCDQHLAERGAFVEVDDQTSKEQRSLTMLQPWIRFSETPTRIVHSGPAVGQHNHDVYRTVLGLTDAEISELAHDDVI